MAKGLIIAGMILVALGLFYLAFPKALTWFGKLPGDINIQRENTRLFIPIASMIVISVILTVISNILSWFLRK